MTIRVDGTTGISGVDGSASLPSYVGVDTNTGIFFPSQDVVAVSVGGTEVMRLNNSGGNLNVTTINNGPIAGARNRIINGDMRIDQRNAGVSTVPTSSGLYTLDRWYVEEVTDGAATVQRSGVAPVGFTSSLLWTTTTADASLAAGQYCSISQIIEGFNISDLNWGTASASPVTLSFWVRSSLTGTFGGSIRNSAINRSYPFTYTISSANTWEYETVTIPGDTTGTWLTDNRHGIQVIFSMGSGSDYIGTSGSWAAANRISATGETSVIGTLNATWYVTGVQLEAGTVATPFERRSYGQELALCQRYYYTVPIGGDGRFRCRAGYWFGTDISSTDVILPVVMRASPIITGSGKAFQPSGGATLGSTSIVEITSSSFRFSVSASAQDASFEFSVSPQFSAEL